MKDLSVYQFVYVIAILSSIFIGIIGEKHYAELMIQIAILGTLFFIIDRIEKWRLNQ